jgi:casein kinase 1
MFIHLLTPGGLSWTRNGVPKTDSAHDHIKRAKKRARPEELCKGIPSEFEEFLRYCRQLKFSACPNYDHWKDEFKALAQDLGFSDIERFIWPPPPAPKVENLAVRPEFVSLILFRSNLKSYGLLHNGRRLMRQRWRTSYMT